MTTRKTIPGSYVRGGFTRDARDEVTLHTGAELDVAKTLIAIFSRARFEAERQDDGRLAIFVVDSQMRGLTTDRRAPIESVADLGRFANAHYSGDLAGADRTQIAEFLGPQYIAEAEGDALNVYLLHQATTDRAHGTINSVADLARVATAKYATRR